MLKRIFLIKTKFEQGCVCISSCRINLNIWELKRPVAVFPWIFARFSHSASNVLHWTKADISADISYAQSVGICICKC